MYIDANTIITSASVLGAVVTIGGVLIAGYKWFSRQNKQDEDIKAMKAELCLLTYGLLACLKGLKEQGCNGAAACGAGTIHGATAIMPAVTYALAAFSIR